MSEACKKISFLELQIWERYFTEQLNETTKEDYYFLKIVKELIINRQEPKDRNKLSKTLSLDDLKLSFQIDPIKKEELSPEEEAKRREIESQRYVAAFASGGSIRIRGVDV